MSRFLALEWDGREARAIAAHKAGDGVVVDRAWAIDLADAGEAGVGERLAAALSEHGGPRADTLVAVPRAKTELRLLLLPKVPDDELPELVRFQAMRQFSALGDDWPLDFVPVDPPDAPQLRVLAAALSTETLQALRATCGQAQATPRHLILRPFASASLLQRRRPDSRCRLLVEILDEDADLTVLVAGRVVFLRSVRLPSEDLGTALVGEIRRTVAAAQNQLADTRIEQVVLCSDGATDQTLVERLRAQLSLEVEPFDPWAGLEFAGRDASPPAHPGRYAALLGLLFDAAAGRPHDLDFLNPRHTPVPPNRRRRFAVLAGAAAAALLLLVGMIGWQFHRYDGRIKLLEAQSRDLEKQVKAAKDLSTQVADIDLFAAGDVNWLD
jgi:hypothetical protein